MYERKDFFPEEFVSQVSDFGLISSEEDWPKISIVMPSFNQVQFIERSILSVLNQGYPNIELIIIDGGSSDGTVKIIKRYEDRIAYWVSEKDEGQSDALNKGFSRASGEIYGWLNSDDLYMPDALKFAVETFTVNQEKKVVFGDWLSIDTDDNLVDVHHAFDFSLNHFKYEGFHLNAQAMFWRSDVHKNFGGFDVDLHNTMDYQMILEFGINIGQEKFLRIPKVLGAFRRYDGQKTGDFTPRVLLEHQSMALRYGYMNKYGRLRALRRLPYRFRRAYWYFNRGGLQELLSRLRAANG
ncbi:glycosyltransferase [Litoricolaceae bacterium]|nr:glycosyltransferase [Litorivicinaceae bacterium]